MLIQTPLRGPNIVRGNLKGTIDTLVTGCDVLERT